MGNAATTGSGSSVPEILGEVTSQSADAPATGSYTPLNDMNLTATVAGTGSFILFQGMASFDTDDADSSCVLGLFIDGSMVAEGKDYVDTAGTEEGSVSLAWWETGLAAGEHTFELRWKEDQVGCIASTDAERSMQVIEFESSDVATEILSEIVLTSADTANVDTYGVMEGMTASPTIAGPSSVVMFTSTATIQGSDAAAEIALFIDGAMVAEGATGSDASNEEGEVTLTWWETGLSAGAHTFEVQWKDSRLGTPIIATDTQRHMQVVEFTGANAPTILSEITSTSVDDTATDTYAVVNDMTASPTIAGTGSLVITTGALTFNAHASDSSASGAIFIDTVLVAEQENFVDDNTQEPGFIGLMWADTGLSAGSHTFDLRFHEAGQAGIIMDTGVQRHLQVVEFAPAGADTDPPTPDPMTFATAPDDASTTSIDMIATTASDPATPVEYLFTYTACGTDPGTGGTSSSWQTSTSYTDNSLQVNQCYGYTVTARDSVPNTGTASSSSEAYTAAAVPGTPDLRRCHLFHPGSDQCGKR